MVQPNIEFTFERALMVFTRSDITPPKVNRFWWNLEHSEYILSDWPWQILGAICAVARAGELGEFFVRYKQRTILLISHRPNFTKFEHNTSIGVAMNPFGTEFCKFSRNGSFFQRRKKLIFYVLRLQAAITPQWLQMDGNSLPTDSSAVGINSKLLPWPIYSVQEISPKNLRHRTRVDSRQSRQISVSRRQPVTIDYWVTWH